MKKILMLVLIICSSNMIKAQDSLSMRTGVNILVKVIEIGTTEDGNSFHLSIEY
jgi:hypothetical protein